jgi:uncharacterized protein (TIGR02145 family)
MTQAEIIAIASPADGLQVYCTTDGKIYIYVAVANLWKEVAYGSGSLSTGFLSCGDYLTIFHVAGTVAPVTKTVTYGTVTNIPGETTKCWITKNLGASQQATAVDDATDASAGWYWQFNRMQGYKHDGITLTPAWTISDINENSDWLTTNDPCTYELGDGWRLPTTTEWINIDAGGGWYDRNGPWNSALKMHAAGYLYFSNGSPGGRGDTGYYWSSTQSGYTGGWTMFFGPGYCDMSSYFKAQGHSVRCLRD